MVKGTFASEMETALRQAGAVARLLQGRVSNIGKPVLTHLPHDDDELQQKRAAKSIADEVIQEILLIAARSILDNASVSVDAEEDTPSTQYFTPVETGSKMSLILDPIDGTLEYIAGDDIYSVCVGLVVDGTMEAALVYFATNDVCYALDETGRSYVADQFSVKGWKSARELATGRHRGRRVYVNGRVEDDVVARLQARNYEVIQDTHKHGGAPACILTCLSGESLGYVAHTRQARDILMGAIIGGARGGSALDWSGEPLRWPARGRVHRAAFLCDDAPQDLIRCLTEQS